MNSRLNILMVSSICFALAMFNMSVIAIAFPDIDKSISSSIFSSQWIINSYILSIVTFGLVVGKLCDIYSPKYLVLFGLQLFWISSLGCILSHSFIIFIFFRILQGLSAAFLLTPSIKMLAEFFERHGFSRAVGIVTGYGSLGLIFSSLFGGILVEYLGWRSVFILNIAICLIATVVLLKVELYKIVNTNLKFIDTISFLFVSLSLFALVFVIMEGHSFGWISSTILVFLFIFLLSLFCFLLLEKYKKNPTISKELFFSKEFIVINIIAFFSETASISLIFLIMYIQKTLGYSPSETGWLIFPLYILILGSNFLSSIWINKHGPYYPMLMCSFIIVMGYGFSIFLLPDKNYMSIFPIILSLGIGLYVMNNATKAVVIEISPFEFSGISLGILENTRNISATISFAILASIITYYKSNVVDNFFYMGFYGVIFICFIIAVLNMFLSIIALRKPKRIEV